MIQALLVRRGAQGLPEAAGPRSGICGSGPLLRLRIIGDSSGAGVGVAHQKDALAGQITQILGTSNKVAWLLDALTGATTCSTLARLKDAHPQPTDIVITALGVNDVTRLVPASLWVKQQHRLFARIQSLYDPRHIYISGMPPLAYFPLLPNPLRWTLAKHSKKLENNLKASIHGNPQITYVPFSVMTLPESMAEDGFHPSALLYTIWAKEMASRICSDWPEVL